ncbi:TadE/TadG family type IV pilus assembly protein [Citrobacter sp. MGH 55]|uniref:TadE/TadG family type IV pilus assembly protein n=1 Tax=Citrobacter sp. MGH 55 TaxID=1439319 RepID=UPI001C0A6BCD|nr:TadE/TadG family type IV pilus assembly protein [Citrobacter sp. MGH 55]
MSRLRRLFADEDGAAAIEFAFVIVPFIVSVLFIMELCRIIFIMASLDALLADSGNATANIQNPSNPDLVHEYFQDAINESASGWALLTLGKEVSIKVEIESCGYDHNQTKPFVNCSELSNTKKPISIYKIEVPYEPLFFVFPVNIMQEKMTRRIVYIQEANVDRSFKDGY